MPVRGKTYYELEGHSLAELQLESLGVRYYVRSYDSINFFWKVAMCKNLSKFQI